MLPWQVMVEAAKADRIDRDPERARQWIERHVPELVDSVEDDEWAVEWPKWQRNFDALLWLAERRARPPKPRSSADRIPRLVVQSVDDALARTRNTTINDFFSDVEMIVHFGDFNMLKRFGSFDEMWSVVFVSYFRPRAVPHQGSVCAECGVALPPTQKRRKLSKAARCSKCRLARWRKENCERQRHLWKNAKQRERRKAAATDTKK
jgi:hypothetical protein